MCFGLDLVEAGSGSGEILTYTYDTAGIYTVTLTVTDDNSATVLDNLSVKLAQKAYERAQSLTEDGYDYLAMVSYQFINASKEISKAE